MKEHILIMNKNDARQTWGAIPDDLWHNLLNNFALKYANRIAFSGMENADAIKKIEIFQDWQPQYVANYTLRFMDEPASTTRNLAVFTFDTELCERLISVPFAAWFVTSEQLPVDELYFFSSDQLLFYTINYESWILFHDLDENLLKALYATDKRMSINLYDSKERIAQVEC